MQRQSRPKPDCVQPKGGKAVHARSGQALPSINPATAATLAERLPVGAVA
jgi:hypothetical protein